MWKKIILLALVLPHTAVEATRFDSSALQSGAPRTAAPKKKEQSKEQLKARAPGKRNRNFAPTLGDEDEQHLRSAIESYSVIMKRTPNQAARNRLVLGRAKAALTLAQRQLYRSKDAVPTAESAHLLQMASKDGLTIAGAQGVEAVMRGEAFFIVGLAALYSDRYEDATRQFEQALKYDSSSRNAAWMSFFIAEELFEAGRFQEAIARYRRCFPRGDSALKKMAYYKMAWAHVNLDQGKMAEDLLVRLAVLPSDDIAKDALKDLAFLVTKLRRENEIIDLANVHFRDKQKQVEFIRAVHANLDAQGLATRRSLIYRRLLSIEEDAAKRFRLRVNSLVNSRSEYASKEHFGAFLEVKQSLEKEKPDKKSPDFQAAMTALDVELQFLIRSFADSYSGRIQNPENIGKEVLGPSLKNAIVFHVKEFPESAVRGPILSLLLDICSDTKDWRCVNQACVVIASDSKLPPELQTRAQNDRLGALEELNRSNPKEYAKEFRKTVEEFVRKQTDQPSWTKVAKRLSELHMDAKEYGDAVNLLEKVYEREKSASTWHALQWARFSDEKFAKILEAQEAKEFQETLDSKAKIGEKRTLDPKLAEILREAALRLTLEARKNGEVDRYTRLLERFMRYNTDPAKALLARKDYISFMLEKGAHAEVTRAMMEFPQQERKSADYQDALTTLCAVHLRNGAFSEILQLVPPAQREGSSDAAYHAFLADLGLKGTASVQALEKLPEERRQYVLSLLALFNSEAALAYFRKHPAGKDSDVAIALTALRIQKESWTFTATASETKMLGGSVPVAMKVHPLTAPEKFIADTRFPNPPTKSSKAGDQAFATALQALMERARKNRQSIVDEIGGKIPTVQMRILSAARQFESKVGQLVLASPVPAGLTPEQVNEYRTALEGLAAEFTDQAGEFAKLEAVAAEAVQKEEIAGVERTPPPPTMADWPWVRAAADTPLASVFRHLTAGKHLGAALVLDTHRKELGERDYFLTRAGILLSSNDGEAMRRYLFEELSAVGRQDVISTWKKRIE